MKVAVGENFDLLPCIYSTLCIVLITYIDIEPFLHLNQS